MKLMQNSGVPIYQQIADSFKTDILAVSYTHLDVYKRQVYRQQHEWQKVIDHAKHDGSGGIHDVEARQS